MTKTAYQLYWDKEFIEKRIQEQSEYNEELLTKAVRGLMEHERYILLMNSSIAIIRRLRAQLANIEKLKINI